MEIIFQKWLKIIDGYVVPFLRSQTGMWVIIGVFIFFILY